MQHLDPIDIAGKLETTIAGHFDNHHQACMMKDHRVEPRNRAISKIHRVDRYAFGVTEIDERLSGWLVRGMKGHKSSYE